MKARLSKSPIFGPAFFLGFVLIAALFVFGPALLSLFLCLGFLKRVASPASVFGALCRGAWIVDWALGVRAEGDHVAGPAYHGQRWQSGFSGEGSSRCPG